VVDGNIWAVGTDVGLDHRVIGARSHWPARLGVPVLLRAVSVDRPVAPRLSQVAARLSERAAGMLPVAVARGVSSWSEGRSGSGCHYRRGRPQSRQ
jgi:hypothetical protein